MNILRWAGLLLIAVLMMQCEENPVDLRVPDREGRIVSDTLYGTIDNTYRIDKTISTLAADRLMIGSHAGFTFRPIIRFINFPTDIEIQEAWIEFVALAQAGDMPSDFIATAYPVRELWLTDTSTVWSDPESNIDRSVSLGELTVTPEDPADTTGTPDTLRFEFTTAGIDTLNRWVAAVEDTNITNAGMILESPMAGFVREVQARNATTRQGIHIFFRYLDDNDSLVTDSLLAESDAFLIDGDWSFDPGFLQEHTVVTTYSNPYVAVVRFNIDTLLTRYPEGALVESANLQMPVNLAQSVLPGESGFDPGLHIYPLRSPVTDPDVEVDSAFVGLGSFGPVSELGIVLMNRYSDDDRYIEVQGGSERQELAINYIQRRLNEPVADSTFSGFYIEVRRQFQYPAAYAFYRANSADPARRPRLIVNSLQLPEERF